jgi:hypothetical protein
MKIIKKGKIRCKVRRVTCDGCGSILEYESSDVHLWHGTSCGKPETEWHIICPVCQEIIEGSHDR